MSEDVEPKQTTDEVTQATKEEITQAAEDVIVVAEAAKTEAVTATSSEIAELKESMTAVNVKLEGLIASLNSSKDTAAVVKNDGETVIVETAELPEKIVSPKKPHWLTKLPKGI